MDWEQREDWYNNNVIEHPEKHGLVRVGFFSENIPYAFNECYIFLDPATNELFGAMDSGCSCPLPFESYYSKDDLAPLIGYRELESYLNAWSPVSYNWDDDGGHQTYPYAVDITEFLAKATIEGWI